jgi:OOP family OmpA-OmpF porin
MKTLSYGVFLMMATLAAGPAAAESCESLYNQAVAAQEKRDTPALRNLALALADDPVCAGDAGLLPVRQAAAQQWFLDLGSQTPPPSGETLLKQLLQIVNLDRIWQAHAVAADTLAELGRPDEATRQYQFALDALRGGDGPVWPAVNDEQARATFKVLFDKAQVQRLLAASYVPFTRTRSNEPSGLAVLGFRGYQMESVALPIEFEFGTIKLTDKGEAALKDLADAEAMRAGDALTLIGHTDPVGDKAYNLALSKRRAEEVKRRLRETYGIRKTIHTDGRGASEPMQGVDTASYTQEQLHQIYRRVEMIP